MVGILTRLGDLHINVLVVESDIPVNHMTALLFELEIEGAWCGHWWVGSYHFINLSHPLGMIFFIVYYLIIIFLHKVSTSECGIRPIAH